MAGKALDGGGRVWEFLPMAVTLTTHIDDGCRSGALDGLVKPGQAYEVEKLSDRELRFRLIEVSERSPARVVKRGKRTLLTSDRVLTQEEVDQALEDFP